MAKETTEKLEGAAQKPPAVWARELKTDPATLAGTTIMRQWDRTPAMVLTRAEYEAAVKAFEGIEIGGIDLPKKDG